MPDRSHIATEQRNPRSAALHTLSAAQCIDLMAREDGRVAEAVRAAGPAITAFVEAAEPRFCNEPTPGKLIYVGAGTSGRLGVLDASEAPPTFQIEPGRIVGIIAGGDAALRKSSEGLEDDPRGALAELQALRLTALDTVLGIAAGGTTPYVLGALQIAKEIVPACLTALLTCSPVPKPASADHLIVLDTGPEVLTGSTRLKAGSATKMALNTISTTLMVRSGRVYQNLMVDLKATNAKLRDRGARVIGAVTGLGREESMTLLDRAGGSAKVAIAMHLLSEDDAGRARTALAAVGGRLGDLVKR